MCFVSLVHGLKLPVILWTGWNELVNPKLYSVALIYIYYLVYNIILFKRL